MKQFWLQVVALMLVSFVAIYATFNPAILDSILSSNRSTNTTTTQTQSSSDNQTKTIMIVSNTGAPKATLKVEIADTAEKRSLGLGGRSSLDGNSGMLFLFDTPSIAHFWMKGMSFPIDMIWINGDTIIGFQENTPPPTGTPGETLPIYSPAESVDKVLEVSSDYVRSHNIVVGDKLEQAQ